jgi:hypothetical protein
MKLLTTIIFLFFFYTITAQTYWQQKTDYRIQVQLNDADHTLDAFLKLNYVNHSPDTLSYIWFHLWPNAYKNDKSAFAQQQLMQNQKKFARSKDDERGYIEGLNFKVNDVLVDVQLNEKFPDVVKLILIKPLAPNDSIIISTPFEVKIPNSFSRLGHVDQSYQITQWFPKAAV